MDGARLCVFLLEEITRLGHEYQDLLRPCDEMHVCRPDFGLYSHPRGFYGMESEAMLTPREISSTGGSVEGIHILNMHENREHVHSPSCPPSVHH